MSISGRNKMSSLQCNLFITLTVLVTVIATTNSHMLSPLAKAQGYLTRYGYLKNSLGKSGSGVRLDKSTWKKAILDFQSFAGINETGKLDKETTQLMSQPRCGVRDIERFGNGNRLKRYALQDSQWHVKNLTFKISKYPKRLKKADVDAEIAKAFAVWSEYTDLTFTQKTVGPVNIEIKFVENEHGDGNAFDGLGGTLGHAYSPRDGGDAHFDDAEPWTINTPIGINLFQVAAHEFGHSLGLRHSEVRSALMAPFYRGYQQDFKLDTDDILGIQALYGNKSSQNGIASYPTGGSDLPNTTQRPNFGPPHVPRDNQLCKDAKIDAIFNSAGGQTFVFKGNQYYMLEANSVADGYPQLISTGWPGLPGDIDAAFTYKYGKTYFFKGTKYWRYTGRRLDNDYPREISHGFPGVPAHLDTALFWTGDSKIYFFKDNKFWIYDPFGLQGSNLTRYIGTWMNLPNNLDAAISYTNGHTYFFKDDKYFRLNDITFSLDITYPPYPRSTASWWFGCESSPSSTSNVWPHGIYNIFNYHWRGYQRVLNAGLALLLPHCPVVDFIEYIPSTRLNGRCHYYSKEINSACTFGAWHPLAAEKLMALDMNAADDMSVFQFGILRIRRPDKLLCGFKFLGY